MNGARAFVVGLTIAAVVVVPGLANWFLGAVGYPTVGSAVWVLGYGLGVLFIWYEWIRPLDITAPEGVSTDEDAADE
ncbi:hypothetical protein ACFQGE_14295 [Halomicroarcula sp. GCM10025817]|uniref:hypothetical protein n=1 Tax=Haloarcula TaxID=2237 RepID=UPI0023E82201|nr:hypothetical protein [Halomicroarcula sp. SYNS111]